MSIEKITFKGIEKNNVKNIKTVEHKFEIAVDEEKSNAAKWMIGATALAAVIGLGIACCKGKLGKAAQEFLDGAENVVNKNSNNIPVSSKQVTSIIPTHVIDDTVDIVEKNGKLITKTADSTIITDIESGKLLVKQVPGEGCKTYYYSKENGNLQFIKYEGQLHNNCMGSEITKLADDGQTKIFSFTNGGNVRYYDPNGNVIDEMSMDFARGAKNYSYNGLRRNEYVESGKGLTKEYYLDVDDGLPVLLNKSGKGTSLYLTYKDKRYAIVNGKVLADNGKEITSDKKLVKEIKAKANEYIKEMKDKHRKTIQMRNSVQAVDKLINSSNGNNFV